MAYTCTMLVYKQDKLLAEESTTLPTDPATLSEVARLVQEGFEADHVMFVGNNQCYYDSNDIGARH